MKFARYRYLDAVTVGAVRGDRVIALAQLLPGVSGSLKAVIAAGQPLWQQLQAALDQQPAGAGALLTEVQLLAPIHDAQKFLAIGMNYQDHADEARKAGIPIPTSQLWFNKQISCITGPFDGIDMPKVSDKLDYEAELGVVIGKRCRHVSVADAQSVIGGYLVMNDVSVRDWQARSPTFTLGKSFDTHGPMGPWITTADEVPDPHALRLTLSVNGEPRQDASTGGMIYNIFEQIAYLSTVMTLEPGDLIATGTPANVGIALGKFLKVGDVVRVEVKGLGAIENRVVPEV
jgi:2-keto-4-pentenoate hydratase/2-oxohepta-3-ene-1,7-dioic acid hydratase in catechol pathway